MDTKLTLRLDEELIDQAKKAAKEKGVSLSKLVADYFKSVSGQQKKQLKESPVLLEIAGILSPKTDRKKLINSHKKHIERKYL